jgi:tryptophan synthase alpha chain
MSKLGIYLLANYPSKEVFLQAVQACQDFGVDFLEVGFAFSDPVADGDLLEKASFEVLKTQGLNDFFESLHAVQKIFSGKIYVMTYANLVYRNGIAEFAGKTGAIDGLILADLPLREMPIFRKGLKGTKVDLVRFLTPESRDEDLSAALKGTGGFIYFVSKRGTTGGGFELDEETKQKIALVRGKGVDVYIGFGIQNRHDVEAVYKVADGAIIGTKAVAELERGIEPFREFLAGLATSGGAQTAS